MIRVVVVPIIIDRGAPAERLVSAINAGSLPDLIATRVQEATERVSAAPPQPKRPVPISDPLADFVLDCCDLGAGRFVCVADLYKAYQRWTGRNRERYPLSREAFNELLQERGVEYSRTRRIDARQCRTWEGISLRPDPELKDSVTARRSLDDVIGKLRRALAALEGAE